MTDRIARLAVPLGIVLIGVGSLLNLLIADTDVVRFAAGLLLGLGIVAELFAAYTLDGTRPA